MVGIIGSGIRHLLTAGQTTSVGPLYLCVECRRKMFALVVSQPSSATSRHHAAIGTDNQVTQSSFPLVYRFCLPFCVCLLDTPALLCLLKKYLRVYDTPIVATLESERVWPIPALIRY